MLLSENQTLSNEECSNESVDYNQESRDGTIEELKGNKKSCKGKKDFSKVWLWLAVLSGIVNEKRRQILLTQPPQVFCQSESTDLHRNVVLQSLMSSSFLRSLRPALFLGTRAFFNSTWAFLKRAPGNSLKKDDDRHREIMLMSHDNSRIVIDWEFPSDCSSKSYQSLEKPVVLIVHGINTDTSFGYIRSLMSACSDNGWIAAGMNLRGYGNIDITTPRLANMAFTNDLRDVVNRISSRLAPNTSLFLVGYSMGGNIVVKYLGEEGMANTLPKCVVGAVSLGNPFKYKKLNFPMNILIDLGSKKQLIRHHRSLRQMTSSSFQNLLSEILYWKWNKSMSKIDGFYSHKIRNNPRFPFETKVGYQNEEEYAKEVGSYQYAPHVNVPLLVLVARDDNISYQNTISSLPQLLANPNIIIVKSKTGGHLGWHASPSNNPFHIENWGDVTVTRFIRSLIDLNEHTTTLPLKSHCITNAKLPRMTSRL